MAGSFSLLPQLVLTGATVWLLTEVAEHKVRQEIEGRQSPALLDWLRQSALIQSVESSNRIEGVTVPRERLHGLVLEDREPRDRPEQEIRGYRRALE